MNIDITVVTSEATRALKRLVSTLLKDVKKSLEKGELCLCMPKGKKGAKKPSARVDAFTNSIRQKIHEFYVVKKVFFNQTITERS